MKMKKLIIMFFVIFLTGCNINYDLTINPDSSVSEKATVEIEDTDDNFNKMKKLFSDNNITKKQYKMTRDGSNIQIIYNKDYDNVEEYILNSDLYKQYFDDIDIEKTKSKTTLSTSADFRTNDISINKDNDNKVTYMQINIISKLPVNSNNADAYNGNTYTWIYNGKQLKKDINISFNNTANVVTIKSIIILCSIIVCILVTVLLIFRTIKQRQRF